MDKDMVFVRRLVAQVGLLSFLFSCSSSSSSQTQNSPQERSGEERIAVRALRMLDVGQGKLINNAVIIVENDKIIAAGSELPIPPGTKIIDLGDSTLLPGLIDAHTHITYHFDETGRFGLVGDQSQESALRYARQNAQLTLEAGFTTIRNLGAGGGIDLRLRDEIRRGDVNGPRMIASGLPLTLNTLSGSNNTGRPERIRQFVKERIAEGADVIKIFEGIDSSGAPVFSAKEIRAAVEEAKQAGLKVAVHAHEAAAIIAAVEGGCDSIEHGTFLNDAAIRLMVKNHTALVPTLYLPTHYLEHKKQFAFESSTWDFFEKLKAANMENLRKAKSKGVWIVDGSDAVAGLHGQNAREIIWLTRAGMKPVEAISAATLDAAELLGLKEQTGEIKQGMFADIIAVPGDPLSDITTLEHVTFVMKSGRIIKSDLQNINPKG